MYIYATTYVHRAIAHPGAIRVADKDLALFLTGHAPVANGQATGSRVREKRLGMGCPVGRDLIAHSL